MLSFDLRTVVNSFTSQVHPNETVILFRNIGYTSVEGKTTPNYSDGETIIVQIQPLKPEEIVHYDRVTVSDNLMNMYVKSKGLLENDVASLVRTLERGGDLLYRYELSETPTWWKVEAKPEDYTGQWDKVRISLQVVPPPFSQTEEWAAQYGGLRIRNTNTP